jgi:Na+/H+-dicarboxylate symporter
MLRLLQLDLAPANTTSSSMATIPTSNRHLPIEVGLRMSGSDFYVPESATNIEQAISL